MSRSCGRSAARGGGAACAGAAAARGAAAGRREQSCRNSSPAPAPLHPVRFLLPVFLSSPCADCCAAWAALRGASLGCPLNRPLGLPCVTPLSPAWPGPPGTPLDEPRVGPACSHNSHGCSRADLRRSVLARFGTGFSCANHYNIFPFPTLPLITAVRKVWFIATVACPLAIIEMYTDP